MSDGMGTFIGGVSAPVGQAHAKKRLARIQALLVPSCPAKSEGSFPFA